MKHREWGSAASCSPAPPLRTVCGQVRHAQARLVELHPSLVIVFLHARHRGLVQLQVAAERGCMGEGSR